MKRALSGTGERTGQGTAGSLVKANSQPLGAMIKVLTHLAEATLSIFLVSVSPSPCALAPPDRPSLSQAWNVQPESSVLLVPLLGDSFYSDSSIPCSPLTLLILDLQDQWGMQRVIAHIVQWGSVLGEPELPPVYGDVEKCVPVQLLCWHTVNTFCKMCILVRV